MRHKGVSVAPSATPSRMNTLPPRKADPAWERGIISERRPDGSRMPILRPGTTTPLRVKEYGERRREIDESIRRTKQTTS